MAKPVIKKSELVNLINDKGYTRKDLAEHYQVSVAEINKYLKVLNIKMRAKKMTYEVIDDTVVVDNVSAVQDANVAENFA
jgi:hypothetical protein